jgi:5-methylcytosine-specific restriction endonuclease McrA
MPTKRIPRSQLSPEELEAVRAKDRATYPQRREKQCAANRQSYAKHRASRLQRQKASLAKRRAKRRAWERAYNAAHPEKVLAKSVRYREGHREATRESTRNWKARNPDKVQAKGKAWRAKNPDKVSAMSKIHKARRRAQKASAPRNDFTAKQWRALCKAAGYLCAYCHKKFPFRQLTIDHITPLSKGGSHTLSNILPACLDCNMHKNAGEVLRPVQPFLLLDEGAAD